MRLYVDSAPVIYTVQQIAPFAQKVDERLTAPGVVVCTSDLARMECLVAPLRDGDGALVADFEEWFAQRAVELVPFDESVFRRAAEIRARFGFRTPDALHLAAALEGCCSTFFTNDERLTRFPHLSVERVRPRE